MHRRQRVAGNTSVLVHPGEFYVGLGADGWLYPAGKEMKLRAVAVAPNGERVEAVQAELKLYRRVWNSVREKSATGRWVWKLVPRSPWSRLITYRKN